MMYRRARHNAIHEALLQFDKAFLLDNKVLFGGGTRIAMELDEFRESVDIDFVCPSIESYRAVRSEVSSSSFGDLVSGELELIREIRADRYGVRTAIKVNDTPIKLEFISFSDYRLSMAETTSLPVPALDQDSCYITKLLALADRYAFPDKKDFIDLLTMQRKWGAPSQKAWAEVKRHYGEAPFKTLHIAARACGGRHGRMAMPFPNMRGGSTGEVVTVSGQSNRTAGRTFGCRVN